MQTAIEVALQQDRVIDITTIGRKSGQPRRFEIWFHNVNGRIFITGTPGKRSWYANMVANPDFTFHLKESVKADIPAKAMAVLDESERRTVFSVITKNVGREAQLESWVEGSPLLEIFLEIP